MDTGRQRKVDLAKEKFFRADLRQNKNPLVDLVLEEKKFSRRLVLCQFLLGRQKVRFDKNLAVSKLLMWFQYHKNFATFFEKRISKLRISEWHDRS